LEILCGWVPHTSAKRKKRVEKAKRDAGSILIFSENSQNISTTNTQIWMFLKNIKGKGKCLSTWLNSLLSLASRDVFSGSLAQSVQGLWPILESKA